MPANRSSKPARGAAVNRANPLELRAGQSDRQLAEWRSCVPFLFVVSPAQRRQARLRLGQLLL